MLCRQLVQHAIHKDADRLGSDRTRRPRLCPVRRKVLAVSIKDEVSPLRAQKQPGDEVLQVGKVLGRGEREVLGIEAGPEGLDGNLSAIRSHRMSPSAGVQESAL